MFSVIIPSLNEEKYLGRLLDSIQQQHLKPAEIIIADAHSKDRTREIARKYGCKIVDGGHISVGRNNGARASTQDILVFLDADTHLRSPAFFNKMIGTFIAKNADVGSCYATNIREESYFPNTTNIAFNATKQLNRVTAKTMKNVIGESGACVICKKALFQKIHGFEEKLKMMEDTEFFQKAVKAGGKYVVIPVFIGISNRRFSKRSLSSSLKISGLILILSAGMLIGIKGLSKIRKKYEDEKGPLGGN